MTLAPFWRCLSSHDMMVLAIQLLGLKNSSPAVNAEKVSYPHPTSRSYPDAEIQAGPQSHLVRKLVGEFSVPYKSLYVPSLFLLKTRLHVTKKINYLLINLNYILFKASFSKLNLLHSAKNHLYQIVLNSIKLNIDFDIKKN